MKIDKLKLLSKGWSVAEIENASKIISEAEDKKHLSRKFFDKTTYWSLFVLLVIVNAACSLVLIPFIFAIQTSFIIIIVTLIGFIFGVLFSILIADIEKTTTGAKNRPLWTMIISGIINFGLIINFSSQFAFETGIPLRHSPYLIGGVYLFAFAVPHIVFKIQEYRRQ